ncbi:enoyl-CoA hydratase/isomerase family protein [Rhizorhapis sp. SPR117]|uniref:enoyl-CoA hydratase/isomerase family protein n=1 Tax=Rhizorhapis sp. SPR117 TaxID=2912611 RepID=UPI001F37CC78|nr:enoyl-CoA hydratase/isomerase family protein [Rhizorhapis sp. SPR117]
MQNALDDSGVEAEMIVERIDNVAVLHLNRPAERNPLGPEFPEKFLRILRELESDVSVSAIVVTGKGKGFCAGADLVQTLKADDDDMESQFQKVRGFSRLVHGIRQLDLPIIAAVNGVAVGGGVSLGLACDIAIAGESAQYMFAFGRVGACAGDMGCAYTLPRLVGSMRARHIMLTGATIGAQEGKELGLFVDVCPDDQVVARAIEIARKVAASAPRRANAATKVAFIRAEETDFETCVTYEAYVQAYLFERPEHHERLEKLLTKIKG